MEREKLVGVIFPNASLIIEKRDKLWAEKGDDIERKGRLLFQYSAVTKSIAFSIRLISDASERITQHIFHKWIK